jgi:hypothetical protein
MLTSTPGADAFGVVVPPPPPPPAKRNHHSRTRTTMTAITATIKALLLLLPSALLTMTGPAKGTTSVMRISPIVAHRA